jgi:hypothetical protein
MRVVSTITVLSFVLGLAAGAARAQSPSEDEQLLEPEPSAAEPQQERRKQSRRDDELDDEELDEQVFYSGFGVSRAETEFSNVAEAINLEGVMGFRIPTLPWFGIELDIAQTIIPGENQPEVDPSQNCGGLLEPPCPGATADPDDFGMQALGISAAFKSTGRFYVTGKYGYRYIVTSLRELDDDRSGNGFAFGVGYRWGKGHSGVELAYKELSEDVESIGLTFFVRAPRR